MPQGLALDIDETLSKTNIFWTESIIELFGNPENLTPKEIVEKYRYTQNVPYWQSQEALDWMESARNSNDFQEQIPLIEDAHHIVQKINKIIPIVAYLTARPTSVVEGTQRWLDRHDFPKAKLITRPNEVPSSEGSLWKAKLLQDMYPEVIGIVDDHPFLADHLSKGYKGVVFLYDNIQHPRKDIEVISCKCWDDVYTAVLEFSESLSKKF